MGSQSRKEVLPGFQPGCRTRRTPLIILTEKIKHAIPRGCVHIDFGAAIDRMEEAQEDADVATFSEKNDLSTWICGGDIKYATFAGYDYAAGNGPHDSPLSVTTRITAFTPGSSCDRKCPVWNCSLSHNSCLTGCYGTTEQQSDTDGLVERIMSGKAPVFFSPTTMGKCSYLSSVAQFMHFRLWQTNNCANF